MTNPGSESPLPPASLAARIANLPQPSAARRSGQRVAELAGEHVDLAQLIERCPQAALLLRTVAEHSPFLWRLCQADPTRLYDLLACEPGDSLRAACEEALVDSQDDEPALMCRLRRARQSVALLVALADLGGVWSLEQVTDALTSFADSAVSAALDHLLRHARETGRLPRNGMEEGASSCGLTLLALGKHGARELNYSSDIDIIVLFDPENLTGNVGANPASLYVKMTKNLVRILQERTGDGYVFRVDLRLRPDPGSTPVAVSIPAAMVYYETVGQNWERAAFIKARPVAGNLDLGRRFLKELSPFIWRRYFDFAAIADIHAMKRQIHAVRGHEAIAVAGHDIKLGRGGIREIEFFVQTQQLIFGGRRPDLRGSRTLDMLESLAADRWITPQARDEMGAAYRFLRTVEHRLQMVADEQTQRLPVDRSNLRRFARFCGFKSFRAFSGALLGHARRVQRHYSLLFEAGASLASLRGSLVFTGAVDDPETLSTLRQVGFRDPALVSETIRGWHFGRRPAVTSARAREILTDLVPPLLDAFSGTGDPDGALLAFDRALGHMRAAVELFSILRSHAALLRLFADILGSAPRLAAIVAARPHVLDAVIDPAFVDTSTDENVVHGRVAAAMRGADAFEDRLDRARDVAHQESFLTGARMLSGVFSPEAAGAAMSATAQALIGELLDAVQSSFAAEHGRIEGGRVAVLGLGKLGGREMTASSDLDLIILYDFDSNHAQSDGRRPLQPGQYYTRLSQRLVSALTIPTRRGRLYEVDMRLRPSGGKGPVATQFNGFTAYQAEEAELWEHMALTRARAVAGDLFLRELADGAVNSILRTERDADHVWREVVAMRRLVAQEKGDRGELDLKLAAGGLLDCEFIAQGCVLAHSHVFGSTLPTHTGHVLRVARDAGLLRSGNAELLIQAYDLMRDVAQWQSLTVQDGFELDRLAPVLGKRIATALGVPSFENLAAQLKDVRMAVRAVFDEIATQVGTPS